jgi:hypothetical protein
VYNQLYKGLYKLLYNERAMLSTRPGEDMRRSLCEARVARQVHETTVDGSRSTGAERAT